MSSFKHTNPQKRAIQHRDGNLLIIACAGSGKTEVLSKRIAMLVNEGVPRNSIVAFTFMERAAKELKTRIREHLEELIPNDPSIGDMYVGTIHSFCLQLLKEIDASYRGYEVMDEDRLAALLISNYYDLGLNVLESRTNRGRYTDAIDYFKTTLNILHLEQIPLTSLDDELKNVIERYYSLSREAPNYFFDFNSIIAELINHLKSDSSVLSEVRERFSHLFVDEYQDVDPRQEELIQLLSNKGAESKVTVVGDDDQSIFGWRGTRVENILTFEERYPNVTTIDMTDNFRSTHGIVEIANAAIGQLPERLEKAMDARNWVENDSGNLELSDRLSEQGDIQRQILNSEQDEAEWIADRIENLLGTKIQDKDGRERGLHYSDIAILLRSVSNAGDEIIEELNNRDIPWVVKGTNGLFLRPEIQLVYAAFCLLARSDFHYVDLEDDYHELSEAETRDFIREIIDEEILPNADATSFLGWISQKKNTLDKQKLPKAKRGNVSRRIYPQSIFHEILAELGVNNETDEIPEHVMYNFGQFSRLLTEFEAVHQWVTPSDLSNLIIYLGVWARRKADEGTPDETVQPNSVQILTIHKSKGLEWPAVFVPRISGRHFPSSMRNHSPNSFIPDELYNQNLYIDGDEGERRLWYVAITRARKFLNLSAVDRKRHRSKDFIDEIQHDYVRDDNTDPTVRESMEPIPKSDVEIFPTNFSDLNYYWECPFDYKLRSLMDFSPGVNERYGYGQQVHNILAEIHDLASEGAEITEKLIEKLIDDRFHLRYTRGAPFEALKKSALKSLQRYVNEFPDHEHLVLESEKPFEFVDPESGALISGTIDLLEKVETDESGNEFLEPVCVIDFKTHKWESFEDFLDKKETVAKQLKLYAKAVRESLGFDPKDAVAYFLSPNPPSQELLDKGVEEELHIDVSDEERERVRMKTAQTVESIRNDKFPRTGPENGRCPKCDFQMICSGYQEYQVMNDGSEPKSLEKMKKEERQLELDEFPES